MSPNEKLLEAIRNRGDKQAPFGEGITTADRYVKTLRECVGSDLCYRYAAAKNRSFEDVMRKAAETLTYRNSDMQLVSTKEKSTFSPSDWNSLKQASGISDEIELPKNTLMVFRHVLTTPRKDRDGDVMRTQGAQVDPKMLLLWQHVHTLPIGKMVAVAQHNSQKLELISAIVDMNELCHDAAVMVDNDMGRFSHGFRALDFDQLKEEEGETTSPGGFDVKRFEIMEESLVSVPSNLDAETEEVLLSLVEGEKLTSDLMKETGRHIREKLPKQFSGVDLEKITREEIRKALRSQNDANEPGDGSAASKGQGQGCGCGNKTGASEQADGEAEGQTKEANDAEDPQVDGEKRVAPGQLQNSWEHIEHRLSAQAPRFLELSGISLTDRFVWLVGTFADHAIVCTEHHQAGVPDEFIYYKIAWMMEGNEPRFEGDPQRVEINFTAEEVAERSPRYEIKRGEPKTEKAGARLSRANRQKLMDVKGDLEELKDKESDMSRGGRAIVERDITKLTDVIGEEEEERSPEELTTKRAVAFILTDASDEDRKQLLSALQVMQRGEEQSKRKHKRERLKQLLAN